MSRGQSGEPQAGQLNGQGVNLALATWTFAINFWAWNLIGPLSATYTKDMSLTSTQAALLVATPILVGSVGRIPVGALTDRFGGRVMFAVVSLVTIAPVLLVAFAGSIDSYVLLLVFGFFLGIGGTTFAIGIPFAKAWYEPARRGFATGVFGAGMGGTALSAFFTPRFVIWFGYVPAHVIIAVALALTALLVWTRMKDSPDWHPNTGAVLPKLAAAGEAGDHLADGVPVCGGLRRVRRLQHLPADLSEDDLRLLADRRRRPNRRVRHRRGHRPADRRDPVRPDPPEDRGDDLAGRDRGDGGGGGAATRPGDRGGCDASSRWPSSSASAPAGCSPGWRCPRRPIGSVR